MEKDYNIKDKSLSSDWCVLLPLYRAGDGLLEKWFCSKNTLRVTFPLHFKRLQGHAELLISANDNSVNTSVLSLWWIRAMFSYHFYQFPFQSCCVVFMDVLFSPVLQLKDKENSHFWGAWLEGQTKVTRWCHSTSNALKIQMLWITHRLDLPYWWSWLSDPHISHSLPSLQSRQVISPQGCWIFARGHCVGDLFGNSPETVCVQTDVDLSSTWRLPAEQRKQSSFVSTSHIFCEQLWN